MSITAGIFPWQILPISQDLCVATRTYMYMNAMKVELLILYRTDMVIAARVGSNWVSTV
jgi:hypothetical protein